MNCYNISVSNPHCTRFGLQKSNTPDDFKVDSEHTFRSIHYCL